VPKTRFHITRVIATRSIRVFYTEAIMCVFLGLLGDDSQKLCKCNN